MKEVISVENELVAICEEIDVSQCPWNCACAYLEAKVKPNYPVPALITEVSMWPTHVAVCVLSNVPGSNHDICGDGWDVYHYGY